MAVSAERQVLTRTGEETNASSEPVAILILENTVGCALNVARRDPPHGEA